MLFGGNFNLVFGVDRLRKRFRRVFVDLNQHLSGQFTENDCMASDNIGESEAPMLYYYTGVLHQRQTSLKNLNNAAG